MADHATLLRCLAFGGVLPPITNEALAVELDNIADEEGTDALTAELLREAARRLRGPA